MRILALGVATLDILNTVAAYPREDDEVRILRQHIGRGGNATNTLVVLSQFGHACSWAGTLADEPDSHLIRQDLARYGIDTGYVRHYRQGKVPTSYVLLSDATGSRTITHFRDLPEYQASDFFSIDTRPFDWIHFEGRNVEETRAMLASLRAIGFQRHVSLEVEKPRENIHTLYGYPDILMFSRAYALAAGCDRPERLFEMVRPANNQALLFCAWGEVGAWLQLPDGAIYHEPAVSGRIVDTLGAGDVFNAGIIHGRLSGKSPEQTLRLAVRLAGFKCTQRGLDGLVEYHD